MERDGASSNDASAKDLVLKILLVGAPKSGKTSLVRRLCDKPFREEYLPTLGFDVIAVPYGTYQGRPVSLQLWDVAGSQLHAQPCHHALIGQRADGVLYVLDVTSRDSLQAVDDWNRALSKFIPPWSCKLLIGHKADLPVYVVNDEALSLYVEGADGFRGWCLTVGSSDYGDYDVAARRGGRGTSNPDGRYKGQSLSGEKQLSVSEAMRTLVGHVFRTGGAGGAGARPAGVLGLGASACGALPLPSSSLDTALETVSRLGLGQSDIFSTDGGDSTQSSDEGRNGKRDSGMRELLSRGQGPGTNYGAGSQGVCSVPSQGLIAGDGLEKSGVDPGWQYFAGRMGREEAELLLRGRPEGTFFLRRKSPSVLVLTYVASGGGGGGSSRKGVGGASPRRSDKPQQQKGKTSGGERMEGTSHGRIDGTSVQHALLVYEDGCFSDEKGRLGHFATLQELLNSKISAIARYPLSFHRERDGYVLNPEPGTAHIVATTPVNGTPASLSRDSLKSLPRSSVSPSSFTPGFQSISTWNPFAARKTVSLKSSQPQTAIAGSPSSILPTATGIRISARDGRSSGGIPERAGRSKNSTLGPGGGSSTSGGSLWMEAAAAVEQKATATTSAADSAAGTARARRRSTRARGRARTTGYSTSGGKASPVDSGEGRFSRQQRPRKGSLSSTEDGSVSSSATESAEPDYRRRSGGGGQSAMAKAAEAAAASAAAAAATAAHPKAKHALERMLAVEANVDAATEALELELKPFATRSRSAAAAAASGSGSGSGSVGSGGARRSNRGSPVSSPHRSASPSSRLTAEPYRRFALADVHATSVPRLDAAAALLIDRAWASRHSVLNSVNALRERAVALSLAETFDMTAERVRSLSPSPPTRGHRWAPDGRKQRSAPIFQEGLGSEVLPGTPRAPLKRTLRGTQTNFGNDVFASSHPTFGVGVGLSTCEDFERILGREYEAPSGNTRRQIQEHVMVSSTATEGLATSISLDSRASPISDFHTRGPSSGQRTWVGGGADGLAPALGRRHRSGSPGTTPPETQPSRSSWGDILFELDALEERCERFVASWKEAGVIVAESCQDEDWDVGGVSDRVVSL